MSFGISKSLSMPIRLADDIFISDNNNNSDHIYISAELSVNSNRKNQMWVEVDV